MSYEITTNDLYLVNQNVINLRVRMDVYDLQDVYVTSIESGIVSGSSSIAADSDVRRTASCVINPSEEDKIKISDNGYIWIDKKVKLYLGIYDNIKQGYFWWKQGEYVFVDGTITYDATTNQLSCNMSDLYCLFDGTKSGTLGYKGVEYPAYDEYLTTDMITEAEAYEVDITDKDKTYAWLAEYYPNILTSSSDKTLKDYAWEIITNDDLTDEQIEEYMIYISGVIEDATYDKWRYSSFSVKAIVKHNIIRECLINALDELAYVHNYEIGYIGEAKGMPRYYTNTWDYMKYREENPMWQDVPYDLEFSTDATIASVIDSLRDLYENYECFFDIDGTFVCQQIPSGDDDPVFIDNSFLQDVLISENTSITFTEPKNCTIVYGESFEPLFYKDNSVDYTDNVYSFTLDGYITKDNANYSNGDTIAFLVPAENEQNPFLKIGDLDPIPIMNENYEHGLKKGELAANRVYNFEIKSTYNSSTKKYDAKAYLQGLYECTAMEVLTDGTVGEVERTFSDTYRARYSIDWFKDNYNCQDVHFSVIPDSPFTIQKIGVALNVVNDDKISSVSVAMETAVQKNYRSCRLTDNITIVTKLLPFVDVNQLCTYRSCNEIEANKYLIKSVNHDWESGQTTLTLVRYYRLYYITE